MPTLAVNNPTICSGQTAAVTVTASLPGGTYIWSPGNQTSQGISVSPSSTAAYSVVYTVNSCSAAVTATVLVNATPTVSIAPATICEGQTATLTAVPSISGGTYAWVPSGQTSQSISDAPASASVYGVLYALNGCTATATGSISVEVNPVLTLSPSSTTTTPFESVIITATGGGNYNWNTGETSSVISVSPQNSTTYCATVTTIAGCKNTACIEIIVMDESTLYIPNVFTPNGDGVNDVFYTPNRNIVSYSLTIFNRWGQLLFNADDASKGWDGSYKGKIVPDGVYVFMLQAKGADNVIYKQSGHITVFQ
jgi:gliding motility-associated-like protein